MASPVTTNVTITPGEGWVALTSANITSFLRVSKFPHHVPVFLAFGSTPPSSTTAGGFRWEEKSTYFQGTLTGNVYARIQNNSNDNVVVSVFAN